MSIERTESVSSRRRIVLETAGDFVRKLRIEILRGRMEISAIEPNRSPLLVLIWFVLGAESSIVVTFVNGSRSSDVRRSITI